MGHVIPDFNGSLVATKKAATGHCERNPGVARTEGGRSIIRPAGSQAELLATLDKHYRELDLAFCKPLRDLRRVICGGIVEEEVVVPVEHAPNQSDSTPRDQSLEHTESATKPSPQREKRAKSSAGETKNAAAGSAKRKPGRRQKTVDDLNCEQWMVAQAVIDASVVSRSGRQWAAVGPWTSSRTYERTGVYRAWRKERLLQAQAVTEQMQVAVGDCLGDVDEVIGMRVSERKISLAKERPSKRDIDLDRAARRFLADAEAEARSRE